MPRVVWSEFVCDGKVEFIGEFWFGSTAGVWPTMLQAAKRGASSLPLFPLTNPPTEKYYFHSLPRVALLLHTYIPLHPSILFA